ncbi:MAG: D-sedoheptulose-7-phosphate isomerase [Streptosporangiaceae bacterium]
MTRVPRPAGHSTRPPWAEPARAAQAPDPPGQAPDAEPGSMEALYPFLYPGRTDLAAVLEQATESSVAKAREVLALRAELSDQYAGALTACARDAAARFAAGGRLLTFGNGGSATDAQQLASLFLYPGPGLPALPAIGLASDTAVLTALSNDIGVEVVFARQIGAFGRPHDIALGLSTSGNSPNLLRAFEEAGRRGLMTIGIAGYDGGAMAELDCLDYLFVAPSASIHRIQEAQTTMYHILWELIAAGAGDPVRA